MSTRLRERYDKEVIPALRKEFGITGLQLGVLRILGERPALPLAALRKSLVARSSDSDLVSSARE